MLVHVENNANLHRTVQHVKPLGKKVGVVLNPATPAVSLVEILPDVDLVLVMTVNPGFGGQQFMTSTLDKIRQVRQMIDRVKPDVELEVDGGIDADDGAASGRGGGARAGGGVGGVRRGGGRRGGMDDRSSVAAKG